MTTVLSVTGGATVRVRVSGVSEVTIEAVAKDVPQLPAEIRLQVSATARALLAILLEAYVQTALGLTAEQIGILVLVTLAILWACQQER